MVSGLPWWIPPGCWALSGVLVFHRPCERLLARWLREEHDREESERVTAAALGVPFEKEGVISRLLDSHPDVHTRLHHLQAHLENRR
jgi:hypothetical protein